MEICEEQTIKREREIQLEDEDSQKQHWALSGSYNWDCADSICLAIVISACNSLEKKECKDIEREEH